MSTLNHYADCVVRAMQAKGISATVAIREVLKVGFNRNQLKKLHELIREKQTHHTPSDAVQHETRHKKSLGEDF